MYSKQELQRVAGLTYDPSIKSLFELSITVLATNTPAEEVEELMSFVKSLNAPEKGSKQFLKDFVNNLKVNILQKLPKASKSLLLNEGECVGVINNKLAIQFTKKDFDSYNQITIHKAGLIIPALPNPNNEGNRYYNFIINGKEYETFLEKDFQTDHIPARLSNDNIDMRQAQLYCIESRKEGLKGRFMLHYYVKRNGELELILFFADSSNS